jgi:hypothetical protein
MSKRDDLLNAHLFVCFVFGPGHEVDRDWLKQPGLAESAERGLRLINKTLLRALRKMKR